MKKLCSLVLAFVMVMGCLSILSGCASSDDWKTDENGMVELVIGGIGPLTGDYANYGTSVRNGAQIAVDEINAANAKGVNGFKLVLKFEDSAGSADTATAAYGKLVDDGMKVSLGATLSGETKAVTAAAKADGVLVLTPSGSAVDAIANNNSAFRVCFSDPYQGKASAEYIARYGLASKVAVFYGSDNNYCVGLKETFEAECKEKGISVVATEAFTANSNTDFSAQIAKIASSGADLVFLPIYASDAATFLTQAKGKLDGMKMFGCDGLDGLLTKISNAGDADGVLMLTPFAADNQDTAVQNFVKKYQEKYNATPDQFAADGYDAVYTVVAALKQANLTSEDKDNFNSRIVAAMTKIEVKGVTGTMTWTADGESSKAAIAMEYRSGKAVLFTPDKE